MHVFQKINIIRDYLKIVLIAFSRLASSMLGTEKIPLVYFETMLAWGDGKGVLKVHSIFKRREILNRKKK